MNRQSVNTFTDGMQKDIDKSLMSNKAYLDAQNFRIVTTKGNSTGSLETIKGNKRISSDVVDSGQLIIGSCELRDTIVLFTTDNTSSIPNGGRSMIYTITLNLETESQLSKTVLYDDNLNVDDSTLNFSTYYPIKAIGKYETPNVQKVYWTDGYNNIRYINISTHQTVDGTAFQSDGDYMSVDKFEFLPNFIPIKPTLVNIVGGKINTGMIAYAYQLYIINGSETTFSITSDPIHIVSDNDFLGNTLNYKGDKEVVNSGKGCIIQIDTTDNIGFNRLRLVRIAYPYINAVPIIHICNEIIISPDGGVVNVTDVGEILGELTVDEFNISSTELFSCKDIATKDNKLFVGNIIKKDFIVDDWDARAVRFKLAGDGGTATVYHSATPTTIPASLIGWVGLYPSDHDGINKFNNPDNDGDTSYQWMYQADGATLGAEGLNIKIGFEVEEVVLDNSNDDTTFFTTPPTDSTDLSYESYASPWKGGKLSWQRDEVYRLGVVFGNTRGQVSELKWICDLRMPSLHDVGYHLLSYIDGTDIKTTRLYPTVTFKSFPDNATWAQIHRVKRDRTDRSIVTQAVGLALNTVIEDENTFYRTYSCLYPINTAQGNSTIKLVSPEININRNISKQANDYIEYVTHFNGAGNTVDTVNATPDWKVAVVKYKQNTRVVVAANNISQINDAVYLKSTSSTVDYITIDGDMYNNWGYRTFGGDTLDAKAASGLFVKYTNASWVGDGKTLPIINYRSNVFGSQYGGNTYEVRMSNTSIPCSDIIMEINTPYNIEYGDTFINYFDVSTYLYDLSKAGIDLSFSESAYVPLESSVNCDLRHDTDSAHLTQNNIWANLRQEYLGKQDMQDGYYQSNDLYCYNTVYSQQLDVKPGLSLTVDKILETEFDCMIKASNTKSNGEITDSWTKFGINEFIEVDSIYGPVNVLRFFNNNVYYWQDKAFGALAINDRSLINDKAGAQLVLGTGGVLDRYDYISNFAGCKDKFGLTSSISGIYWYDRISNSIYKFSSSLINLTKEKSMQSYISGYIDSAFKVLSHADAQNNEILFTFFKESETNGTTISFNESVDAFISFYGFVPTLYIPYQQRYLTTTNTYYCGSGFNMNYLFLHDSNIGDRCYFYALSVADPARFVDSTIEILFNSEYEYTKVFDNLFYQSNTSSKNTVTGPVKSVNTDIFADTFSTIQCYNDFQNTGEVTLVTGSFSTPGTNIMRRERGWTLNIPRNIVSDDISTNPDIFTNVDSSQTFKERMRDKYLIAYFTYVNDGTYDRFTVSNMGIRYRTSYR